MSIKVKHPIFGEGRILDSRWNGEELLVKFDNELKLWVHESELKKVGGIPPQRRLSSLRGAHISRRIIEAFRLGIVPHFAIEEFTFGREDETYRFEEGLNELEASGGSALAVEGAYGAGKSHFLDYVYNLAMKKGFVVARADLDPFEVAPYRPMRIYREFMRSLRYLDGGRECGLRDLLKLASGSGLKRNHDFLTPALDLISQDLDDELFWLWIEGDTVPRWYLNNKRFWLRAPIMLNHSTAANNYCYILSGLGHIARNLGLKGLVLFIDEAEVVFRQWYDWNVTKGLNFLIGLILTALNKVSPTPKIERDLMTGLYVEELEDMKLIYNGVRRHRTPYTYDVPSGIFLVIATTPLHAYYSSEHLLRWLDEKRRITLSDLTSDILALMFEKLLTAYKLAYPETEFPQNLTRSIFLKAMKRRGEGIRFFIKASVEALDMLRHFRTGLLNKFIE